MGSVYEGEHAATGRRCAVKVIKAEALTRDRKLTARFEREARAAGVIESQYIAQVLDAGVDEETELPFQVIEFLEGEDFQRLLKQTGPVSPELALRIGAQACLGLQKAHDLKIVHRDIKPHNLFLAKRDAGEVIVKLLDFGIAKVKMDEASSTEGADLTKTGNLLGSPLYMSPEQARGRREIDHRTDIWSLGAVLYQALTGRTPYGHAETLGDLIYALCSEPPPPLQEQAQWVKPEVAAVVHRCLTLDPDARFQSGQEMFEALRELLPHGYGIHEDMLVSLSESVRQEKAPRLPMELPVSSEQPEPVSERVASAEVGAGSVTSAALARSQSEATAPPAPSSKKGIVAAVAVAAVGGAVAVYLWTRPPPDPVAAASGPPATAASAPQPAATAAPTATPAATPTDATPKRVRVVILPSDAKVEVEGEPAKLRDGILEIEGKPGSVFRVRAFKGKDETIADVVVTEAGALPPKIEVKAGKKIRVPRGGGSQPSKDSSGASQSAPAVPKGISTAVDEFGP